MTVTMLDRTVCEVLRCAFCDVVYVVPSIVFEDQRHHGGFNYCSNGHPQGRERDEEPLFDEVLRQAEIVAEGALGRGHNAPVREIVVAVIEALREPDGDMCSAGYVDCPDDDEGLEQAWAELSPWDIWPAMIDRLLLQAERTKK